MYRWNRKEPKAATDSGDRSINENKYSSTGQKNNKSGASKRSKEAAVTAIVDCQAFKDFVITKSSLKFAAPLHDGTT